MKYQILYHSDVKDDLAKIPRNIKDRICKAIELRLMVDPLHYGDFLKKSLSGYCKMRVGDFRVIYRLKENNIIVVKIGHRKEVYKNVFSRIGF